MKKLPYYRLWVKDFETDENVRVLDFSELGLYLSCLNHSWINEGLPVNPGDIRRAMKATVSQFNKMWPRVSKCFREKGGRLVNDRQETEREKALSKSVQSSEAVSERERKRRAAIIGRSSDDHPYARAGAESVCVFDTSSLENQEENRNPTSLARPISIDRAPTAVGFPEFYERWAALTKRRTNESAACQAWLSVVPPNAIANVMACLERYGASGDVARGAITNPDRWLFEQARDGWRGDWPALPAARNGHVAETMRYLDEN